MLAGDKQRFAIEAQVESRLPSGWVFGRFRFWPDGIPVGDCEDSAALNACVNHLRSFAAEPVSRFDRQLAGLAARQVLQRVRSLFGDGPYDPENEHLWRFWLSGVGMSSFERVDLLLLTDEVGGQRVIWREAEGDVHEILLRAKEMERVAKAFCDEFEGQSA